MNYRCAIIALLLAIALQVSAGESVTVIKPVYTEVYLRSNPSVKISGSLLRYDDDSFVLKVSNGQRELNWLDLTGTSAFALRARLIDRNNPEDWMTVGRLAWALAQKTRLSVPLIRRSSWMVPIDRRSRRFSRPPPAAPSNAPRLQPTRASATRRIPTRWSST